MERDAIHYLAINSVRVSVSAAPLTPACLRGGVVLRGGFSHKQQRLKTKRRGTKKHVEVTVWAQAGAAEVCKLGRSVGQSVAPSPGREGAASLARWLTFSVRTAALCCGECGAVITPANYTELSSLSSSWHTLPAARGPEVLYSLPSSIRPDLTQIGLVRLKKYRKQVTQGSPL